jgi:hypothetical protein
MLSEIPAEKLNDVLANLEAEKERRLQARIDAGELVSVQLFVVVSAASEIDAKTEEAKAQKLAELRSAGEKREVHWDVETIVTGVPRAPDTGWRKASIAEPHVAEPSSHDEEDAPLPLETAQPSTESQYIYAQIRPDLINEGRFTVERGTVFVTDIHGVALANATLPPGQDPASVARRLLRETATEEDFYRRREYPNLGLA